MKSSVSDGIGLNYPLSSAATSSQSRREVREVTTLWGISHSSEHDPGTQRPGGDQTHSLEWVSPGGGTRQGELYYQSVHSLSRKWSWLLSHAWEARSTESQHLWTAPGWAGRVSNYLWASSWLLSLSGQNRLHGTFILGCVWGPSRQLPGQPELLWVQLLGEAHWGKLPTLARHHTNHSHEIFYDRRSW